MVKKTVVAVIDSGVDMREQYFKDCKVKNYKLENESFEICCGQVRNTHGEEVVRILLHEDPKLEIISIQTLQENNKCSLFHIIKAIQYCIDLNVDVINMSLGTTKLDLNKYELLKSVCDRAIDRGIVIFAADNNVKGKISYPANYDKVIGVKANDEMNGYCEVSYMQETICFSENVVYVPENSRCTIRSGTSYLCPMIVGLFCQYAKGDTRRSDIVKDFFKYMNKFSEEEHIKRIYFDRKNPKEYTFLYGKRILFFADEMDFNNIRIYDFYKNYSNIKECFEDIYLKDRETILQCLNGVDVFYIGVLGGDFIKKNEDYLKELVLLIGESGVDVLSVLPVINIRQREFCSMKTGKRVSSIYK